MERNAIKNAILTEQTKINAAELRSTLKERSDVHKEMRAKQVGITIDI